jgi:cardiolipin synthase
MGLANWLTVLRILLIPVFVSLLVYQQRGPALAVFLAAALTDLLDGYVARHRGSQSRLGAFLDPLADKLLLMSSFVTLTWLRVLPFWIAAVVISRDLILSSARWPSTWPAAASRRARRARASWPRSSRCRPCFCGC